MYFVWCGVEWRVACVRACVSRRHTFVHTPIEQQSGCAQQARACVRAYSSLSHQIEGIGNEHHLAQEEET